MTRARLLLWTAVLATAAFVTGYAVSHFDLDHAVAARVTAALATDDCLAPMVDDICRGGSLSFERPYERTILDSLPPPAPVTAVSGIPDFAAYLARAVGWHNIPRASIRCAPYRPPVMECFAAYDRLLSARFLYAEGGGDKPLVIVLHGHVATANKVMGLDATDYMRAVGRVLAQDGHAVAAPDLTYDVDVSARLNAQLVLHGIQIYGLWSRVVCDIAGYFAEHDTIVYGLSNGGVIADHVSILCDAGNISLGSSTTS